MVGVILLHGVLPVVIFALAFLIEKKYAEASLQENMSQLWTQASLLKTLYISFAVVIGFALFVLFVNLYSVIISLEWGGKPRADGTLAPINVQNLALAFIGTVSGFGALFGVYLAIRRTEESGRQNDVAEQQAQTAKQTLIKERISKATEDLFKSNSEGKPIIGVRLGALYALEQNARDSERDHVQIMEMLYSYIRTNCPLVGAKDNPKEPREDIRVALAIIARRENWSNSVKRIKEEKAQGCQIDFRDRHLQGAKLTNANLNEALLNGTCLENALLSGVNLSYAVLDDANLSWATLKRANLSNAQLNNAHLFCARLDDADLSHAWLRKANLDDVHFDRANLDEAITTDAYARTGDYTKALNLTQYQVDAMYLGVFAILPVHLNSSPNMPDDDLGPFKFEAAYEKWLKRNR